MTDEERKMIVIAKMRDAEEMLKVADMNIR